MVTDAQVRRLREKRMAGKTLAAAAAAAGMSERAARKWQSGALPSTAKAPRTWRTREDPFADVWQSEVVPPTRPPPPAARSSRENPNIGDDFVAFEDSRPVP